MALEEPRSESQLRYAYFDRTIDYYLDGVVSFNVAVRMYTAYLSALAVSQEIVQEQ